MTRNRQIQKLLNDIPDEAMPQVLGFPRTLAGQPRKTPRKARKIQRGTGSAERSFGLIPANPATVRRVLSEDLYGLD